MTMRFRVRLTTPRLRRSAAGPHWALALLCWALAVGCLSPPAPRAPSLEGANILLVVVDTLGAAHVGCLAAGPAGDRQAAALSPTPNLDRLAAQGVLFRRAYSTAPWTQPAVASPVDLEAALEPRGDSPSSTSSTRRS